MSARKTDTDFSAPSQTRLALRASAIRIRKNGIEFCSANPLPIWTEMTVDLQSVRHDKKLRCNGVVVACNRSNPGGYVVSMLFTDISSQSQEMLQSLRRET